MKVNRSGIYYADRNKRFLEVPVFALKGAMSKFFKLINSKGLSV